MTMQPATAACDVGHRGEYRAASWRVVAFFPATNKKLWLQLNGCFGAEDPEWATVARFERGTDAYVAATRAVRPIGAVIGYFDFQAGQ